MKFPILTSLHGQEKNYIRLQQILLFLGIETLHGIEQLYVPVGGKVDGGGLEM
jgi:hypothetical protein